MVPTQQHGIQTMPNSLLYHSYSILTPESQQTQAYRDTIYTYAAEDQQGSAVERVNDKGNDNKAAATDRYACASCTSAEAGFHRAFRNAVL